MIKWFQNLFYQWGNGPAKTTTAVEEAVNSAVANCNTQINNLLTMLAGGFIAGIIIVLLVTNVKKTKMLEKKFTKE